VVWWGFTAFFDPLIAKFGWSYTAISVAASLRGVEVGLVDIAAGFLLDRFGSRRIIFGGSLLVSAGYFLLSRVGSLSGFYAAYLLVCIGGTSLSNVVFFSLVSRWFRKRLGLAMGISAMGFGAGGFAVPVIVRLLDVLGLSLTFVVLGLAALVVGGVLALFVRNRPEDVGSGPDGTPLRSDAGSPASVHALAGGQDAGKAGFTFKEAISTQAVWIVTAVGVVNVFCVSIVTTHVMPYLGSAGYSRQYAGLVAMMIPVMSILGRVGAGWLSDLVSRKIVLLLAVLGECVAVVLFMYVRMTFLLIPFLIFFGFSWGGIAILRAVILREYYGTACIGSLIGLCLGLGQLGSISGPLFAGWIFDTTGSYTVAFTVTASLLLAAAPLVLLIKPPSSVSVTDKARR